jgi:hypothetical protein
MVEIAVLPLRRERQEVGGINSYQAQFVHFATFISHSFSFALNGPHSAR